MLIPTIVHQSAPPADLTMHSLKLLYIFTRFRGTQLNKEFLSNDKTYDILYSVVYHYNGV